MKSKFLVIGCGSIGRRHLRNLKALGIENLIAFDPSFENLAKAHEETGVKTFDDFEKAFNQDVDVCFICSPSSWHTEQSIAAAHKGWHLFIEKPLSHNFSEINVLNNLVKEKKIISLVGCNMRFHPGPQKVKELIDELAIGRILFAQVQAGSYLPEWRPATDYRMSYSGREDLGGGAILDCIHEIDLAFWYSGTAREVFGIAERLSLDIETEDVAMLILRHTNNILSEIHLDYVQRTYERGCKIVGEKGSIFWDFNSKQVKLYQAEEKKWEVFLQPEHWEINQMYLDETQHFLDCIENNRETICPVSQATQVLKIALAAKKSSENKTFVSIS